MGVLKGKTAILTGSASGIGREIAKRFLEEGANIVLFDVNKEKLAEAKGEISANDERIIAVVASVRGNALDTLNDKDGWDDFKRASAGVARLIRKTMDELHDEDHRKGGAHRVEAVGGGEADGGEHDGERHGDGEVRGPLEEAGDPGEGYRPSCPDRRHGHGRSDRRRHHDHGAQRAPAAVGHDH